MSELSLDTFRTFGSEVRRAVVSVDRYLVQRTDQVCVQVITDQPFSDGIVRG